MIKSLYAKFQSSVLLLFDVQETSQLKKVQGFFIK